MLEMLGKQDPAGPPLVDHKLLKDRKVHKCAQKAAFDRIITFGGDSVGRRDRDR